MLRNPLLLATVVSMLAWVVTAETDDSAASLLPAGASEPPPSGLVIRSPTDSYTVPPNDILMPDTFFDSGSGAHTVTFGVGSTTGQWIASQTAAHVGETFQILICGEVINEPVIRAPITGRSLIITGLGNRDEAEAAVAQILGTAPCP